METPIELPGGPVDCEHPPTKFELLKLIRPETRVPLERIRDRDGGSVFDELEVAVAKPLPGMEARLNLAPDGICDELREVRAEAFHTPGEDAFSHRLICRRLRHVSNSVGRDFPGEPCASFDSSQYRYVAWPACPTGRG